MVGKALLEMMVTDSNLKQNNHRQEKPGQEIYLQLC